MSDSPPSVSPDAIAARLRAAGCVFAEEEAELIIATASSAAEADAMVERRAAGSPLEQVLGWASFMGLRIAVEADVFVPRRRTEFLAERAALLLPRHALVVDLCCGTGAIGAALCASAAASGGTVELRAADVDPASVRCARRNVAPFGGHVHGGDLFDALPGTLRGRVDVLVANVPYVPSGEVGLLPVEAREHEPLTALDGGADGLAVLRRVASAAPGWLAPGGTLLSETSERQADAARAVFVSAGLTARLEEDDDRGATVVAGRLPG